MSATASRDTTFGVGGYAILNIGAGGAEALAAKLDSKGYVVVVGANGTNGFITRLFP